MAEKRDYYDILEINKNATENEIKSAYRKLAKKYHPDNKETGDAEKFKECSEAYSVLSDSNKRKTYDQFGHAAFDQTAGGSNPFAGSGFEGFNFNGGDFSDLNDIFASMFGFGGGSSSRRSKSGPTRGEDTLMRIKISFMDAVLGTTLDLPISYDETCEFCNGTGAKDGVAYDTCPECHGQGVVLTQQRSIFGIIQSQTTCSRCQGKGKIIKENCKHCNGKGYNFTKKKIEVKIPQGINNQQQIRIAGKGNRGMNGGPNGDLYIEVLVADHKNFTRDGNDIHLTIPVDFIDVCLGTTITVPTVYGEVEMKIPAGTQSTQVFKLRNKGVKDLRSSFHGDQFVHLNVKTPTDLNKEQKNALKMFKEASDTKESIFDKFRNAFRK
ncbi:MAG: molecular chaperone DnaJ [Bacillales bacterium]